MRIRPARGDDFAAVTRLLEALGRPAVTDETIDDCRVIWEDQVVDPGSHHSVAEEDGRVVGFCSLHFRTRLNHPTEEAWVPDLFVAESARRGGVGRALLEEAERRARDRGCHMLVLESGYNRAEAHHLYRRFKMRDSGKVFYKLLKREPLRQ